MEQKIDVDLYELAKNKNKIKATFETLRKNNKLLDNAIKGEIDLEDEVDKMIYEIKSHKKHLPYVLSKEYRSKIKDMVNIIGRYLPKDNFESLVGNTLAFSLISPSLAVGNLALIKLMNMKKHRQKKMSRRDFLNVLGLTATSGLLFGGMGYGISNKYRNSMQYAKLRAKYIQDIINEVYNR